MTFISENGVRKAVIDSLCDGVLFGYLLMLSTWGLTRMTDYFTGLVFAVSVLFFSTFFVRKYVERAVNKVKEGN